MSAMEVTMTRTGTQSGFTPLVQRRRPQTSHCEYQSFAAQPRIRSARYPSEVVAMPRSHVSIARFYDWSEDLNDCVSVSKFYRNIASTHKQDKIRNAGQRWSNSGVNVNPGRMFLRDKAGLTKGEREIIEGIYRNRGDLQREDGISFTPRDEWHFVRSHKDAWLIGKNIQKDGLKIDPTSDLKLPDYLFSRLSEIERASPRHFCLYCEASFLNNSDTLDRRFVCLHRREEAPAAPPTTPDKDLNEPDQGDSPRRNKRRQPVFKTEHESNTNEQRIRLLKSVDESYNNNMNNDSFGGSNSVSKSSGCSKYNNCEVHVNKSNNDHTGHNNKKKVYVNVFLPKIPSDISHDGHVALTIDAKRNNFMDGGKNGVREGSRVSRYKHELLSPTNTAVLLDNRRTPRDCYKLDSTAGE